MEMEQFVIPLEGVCNIFYAYVLDGPFVTFN